MKMVDTTTVAGAVKHRSDNKATYARLTLGFLYLSSTRETLTFANLYDSMLGVCFAIVHTDTVI